MLTDTFVRDLHYQLYGDVWAWAGRYRTREVNIGVAPASIAQELRESLDTVLYRWQHTSDWDARQLGIIAHAETVRIHPFVDGNGRATRLLADVVFAVAQDGSDWCEYDWELEKAGYIAALRRYDMTRDATELTAYVPIRPLDLED